MWTPLFVLGSGPLSKVLLLGPNIDICQSSASTCGSRGYCEPLTPLLIHAGMPAYDAQLLQQHSAFATCKESDIGATDAGCCMNMLFIREEKKHQIITPRRMSPNSEERAHTDMVALLGGDNFFPSLIKWPSCKKPGRRTCLLSFIVTNTILVFNGIN